MSGAPAPKKETPMAFEPTPHDSLRPDPAASPFNGISRHSNPASPPGNMQSPNGINPSYSNLLSPTSNSQAVVSESPTVQSDPQLYSALPGNSSTYWYDMYRKYQKHIDAERELHRQEIDAYRNEISGLQAQLSMLSRESSAYPRRPDRKPAAGVSLGEQSFYPDEETLRRSREGLERIRQPSVDALDRSRSVSPSKYPPPPPSIASIHAPLNRLTSIDEHGPPSNVNRNASLGVGGAFGLGVSTTTSPLGGDTPRSPPPSAATRSSRTPAGQPSQAHQRARRLSESQYPETVSAAARAVSAIGGEGSGDDINGDSADLEAGKNLENDPLLKGPLALPNNPEGMNSRKSEEFLSALWNKVTSDAEPAVLRSTDASTKMEGVGEVLHGDEIEEMADGPILKTQRSTNFGAPFGSLRGISRR